MAVKAKFLTSGERFVPEETVSDWTYAHHISRYQFAKHHLYKDAVVLDCGSGVGYGTATFADHAGFIVGGDLSFNSVEYAQNKYNRQRSLHFLCFNGLHLPLASNSCDVIICFELIEHIIEQLPLLDELKRVLKPKGTLVISTPERDSYNRFIGAPNPYHVKELNYDEFRELLVSRFSDVSIFWQTAKFPVMEFYKSRQEIAELRQQLDSFKMLVRQPWLVAFRNPIARRLKKFLPQATRNKVQLQAYPPNKTRQEDSFPKPEHFSFEAQQGEGSLYMVAVCQKRGE